MCGAFVAKLAEATKDKSDGEKQPRARGKNGGRRVWLVSGNAAYAPVEVQEGHELVIWGVVTHVIHKCG